VAGAGAVVIAAGTVLLSRRAPARSEQVA
jgi:hypothetical protein